jgi:SNF2 family DNA or RNA helicase
MEKNNPEDDFAAEEKKLLERLDQLRKLQAKKLEEERQAKLREEIQISVEAVVNNRYVNFTLPKLRPDIDNYLKGTPNRSQTRAGLNNTVGVRYWPALRDNLAKLPGVTFRYAMGVEDSINEILTGAHFKVDIIDGRFHVLPTAMCINDWKLNNLPSTNKRAGDWHYTIQLVDTPHLVEALKDENVDYSPKAQEYIEHQIRLRAAIDELALKEDFPELKVPFIDGLDLKAFQRVGVAFTELVGGNAIIADEMGLGKTIQAIAYFIRNNLRVVIICPASLKTNWWRMIKQFTGIEATVLSGVYPENDTLVYLINNNPQIIIINYEMMGKAIEEEKEEIDPITKFKTIKKSKRWLWVEAINMFIKPDLIVTDESHKLKNVDSRRSQASRHLKAPRFLCLTGTPIVNRPGELWPLLALVAPELYPNYEQFLFRYSPDKKSVHNVHELRENVKPYVLRRNKKQVIKDLPPINRIMEWHDLTTEARQRYQLALDGVYQVLSTYNPSAAGEEWKITHILAQLIRLKQITTEDKLDAVAEHVTNIVDQSDPDERNNKVIVFSQFQGSVNGLVARLNEVGVAGFDGTTSQHRRTEICDRFQNDDRTKVLVTTTQVAGEGLTLTRAGDIVFTDLMWTPAAHEQAEARAYGRVNDLHSVNSHYFLATNTIDEDIWELLAFKTDIINQVVDGVNEARIHDQSLVKELIMRLKGKR